MDSVVGTDIDVSEHSHGTHRISRVSVLDEISVACILPIAGENGQRTFQPPKSFIAYQKY